MQHLLGPPFSAERVGMVAVDCKVVIDWKSENIHAWTIHVFAFAIGPVNLAVSVKSPKQRIKSKLGKDA